MTDAMIKLICAVNVPVKEHWGRAGVPQFTLLLDGHILE
jgi:hypothetical protein